MAIELQYLLIALGAALSGSIPFSLFIAKWGGGIDLRQHGSGNVGATNVARTMGAKWGSLALLLDAAKGALPTYFLPSLLNPVPAEQANAQALCGIAAVLGHMFSPFLSFKGGKGVATALGAVLVMSPVASLIALAVFIVTFAAFRIVSLSSIWGAIAFLIAQVLMQGERLWGEQSWGLGAFAIAVPLLIVFRHRTNIVRIFRGQEARLEFGKKSAAKPESTTGSEKMHSSTK